MDQRERNTDFQEALITVLEGWTRANLWTALPAIIVSYNPATVTAVVQIAIQLGVKSNNLTGAYTPTTVAPCPDVPVVFPSGGGAGVTFGLVPGDEGILVFSARTIDLWWAKGGVQPTAYGGQGEFRDFDVNDGMFVPGLFSQPRALTLLGQPAPGAVRIGTFDGLGYVEVAPAGVVNVVAPGGINLIGPLNIEGVATGPAGAIALNAAVTVTGELTANGTPLSSHTHGGVTAGTGVTGVPIP